MAIEPRAPLEPGPEHMWNESQFFFWFDRERDVAGFHRLAHQPNAGTQHRWSAVFGPEGARYLRCDDDLPHHSSDRTGGAYRSDALHVAYEGSSTTRLRYDTADCGYSLEMVDRHEPIDKMAVTAGSQAHARDVTGGGHVEAATEVRGTVRVGGTDYTIDGLGHRDHAWGSRDIGGMLSHRWVVGTTTMRTSFSALKVMMVDGTSFTAGYVMRDEQVVALADLCVTMNVLEDGISCSGGQATLTLADRSEVTIEIKRILDAALFHAGTYRGIDNVCEVLVDGETGVADFEVSAPVANPASPHLLGVCTTQGLSTR